LELVDHLAWAAGWGILAIPRRDGSQKNYSMHQLQDINAICFDVGETALSFITKCAINRIKCFGLIEISKFPQPWTCEDEGASFIVRDANKRAIKHVYYVENEQFLHVTKDEAQRIAANIVKLPGLLGRPELH
jgi:hypothetical protein